MAIDVQNPGGQTGFASQSIVTQLANNMLQFSSLLQTLNNSIKGIGMIQFVAVPATSASPGAPNQVAVDATHFYFYAGTQWLRVTGTTF